MVGHAGKRLVTDECAYRNSEDDAPIEDGSLPFQLWMFGDRPRLLVIFTRN